MNVALPPSSLPSFIALCPRTELTNFPACLPAVDCFLPAEAAAIRTAAKIVENPSGKLKLFLNGRTCPSDIYSTALSLSGLFKTAITKVPLHDQSLLNSAILAIDRFLPSNYYYPNSEKRTKSTLPNKLYPLVNAGLNTDPSQLSRIPHNKRPVIQISRNNWNKFSRRSGNDEPTPPENDYQFRLDNVMWPYPYTANIPKMSLTISPAHGQKGGFTLKVNEPNLFANEISNRIVRQRAVAFLHGMLWWLGEQHIRDGNKIVQSEPLPEIYTRMPPPCGYRPFADDDDL